MPRVRRGQAFSRLVPDAPDLLSVSTALSVVFPLWFFRYARSFWMGFDEYFDPVQRHDKPGQIDAK